jgi:peptide/nickel transport system permease protein
VLAEAFLSFLGIGLQAEAASWGSLLNMAKTNTSAWWMAVFPGMAIFVIVLSFNLIGEGLSNAIERSQP